MSADAGDVMVVCGPWRSAQYTVWWCPEYGWTPDALVPPALEVSLLAAGVLAWLAARARAAGVPA
ncbi:MAG: hypothetical protein IPM35_02650 [Myxococcales bacterium]|nr:hypothetical protein [Myxococcales bacterium]